MQSPIFTNNQVSASRIIYTASSFARSALLHLQEVGTLTAISPHTSARSGLASYLFFMVKSGSGVLTYEGTEYELEAGDCVFISCEKPYSHCSSDDLWTLSWVHFYGPNMQQIYRKYRQRGGKAVFEAGTAKEYEALLNTVTEKAGSDSYIRDMEISDYLGRLLVLLMNETVVHSVSDDHISTSSTDRKINIANVKEYVDRHFTESISLEDLAERFFINRSYLARIFKEKYGVTITAYVNQQRVTKAKELLRFTDATVEAIAVDCGFEPNYFARVFKKLEGISPSEYRTKW